MQILVIPSWYSTSKHPYTGIYVKEQCKFIKKKGVEVHLMYADLGPSAWSVPLSQQFRYTKQLEGELLTYRMSGILPPKNNSWSLKLWIKYYERLFLFYLTNEGKPSIIHAHSYLAGQFAAYLKNKYHIPFVLTEHSSHFLSKRFSEFQKRLIAKSFEQSDQIIAVSEPLKQSMQPFTNKAITTIPNLVNTDLFTISQKGKPPETRFKFIFVGSLISLKQPLLLLEAFDQLAQKQLNIELHIVGRGRLDGVLEQKVKALGLQGQVFLHGARSSKETAGLMADSHALVLPSRVETFGIVLIEAMACGLPVIATRSGGPTFLVDDDTGILISPNSKLELEKAMLYMMKHYDYYQGELIRNRAVNQFSGTSIAKKIIEVYQQVLS